MLIPLGALLIVMLRNIIGVQTFGTFMPVLIALSFRETQLVGGVVLFTLIVALGLTIRFYLERLKLLLVPRLAAVVITVILLMALVTIASHRMNLEIGLSVALFPMVILAMTIERMSIVWEELGAGDAIRQGIGSLIVAAACYLLMFHPQVEHLVFVFLNCCYWCWASHCWWAATPATGSPSCVASGTWPNKCTSHGQAS